MVRGLERFRSSLGMYPEKGDSTTYRRTGRLGRSWAISYTINARGMAGETGTNVEYAHWVQDDELQAWMHRGRWSNTDERVAEQHRGTILADFSTVIEGALSRSSRRNDLAAPIQDQPTAGAAVECTDPVSTLRQSSYAPETWLVYHHPEPVQRPMRLVNQRGVED